MKTCTFYIQKRVLRQRDLRNGENQVYELILNTVKLYIVETLLGGSCSTYLFLSNLDVICDLRVMNTNAKFNLLAEYIFFQLLKLLVRVPVG